MYNLLMSGVEDYWENNAALELDQGRVLSHTSMIYRTLFRNGDHAFLQKIKLYPSLLMYKYSFSAHDGIASMHSRARVGRVKDCIEVDGKWFIMVAIDEQIAPIESQKLAACWKELGIDIRTNENSRTHWAIKEVELESVLKKAGLWVTMDIISKHSSAQQIERDTSKAMSVELLKPPEATDVIHHLEGIPLSISKPFNIRPKVFVVHGRDDGRKSEVARWLSKIGMEEIVLHERPSLGRSILEKFMDVAREASYAVVIGSPDDVGGLVGEAQNPRARQNVILELGFFIGALGPKRVALLRCDHRLEIPSDYSGIVMFDYDQRGAWKFDLAKEFAELKIPFDTSAFF